MESSPLDLAVHKTADDIYSVFIVCDLDPEDLDSTLKFLNSFSSLKSLSKTFTTVLIDEFLSWGLGFNPSAEVLCLHLSLDNEIKNHKLISDHASRLGLKQLNPYNSFAELFDNKFLFYNFMLAEGFKQAKTYFLKKDESLSELSATIEALGSGLKLDYHTSPSIRFILKPCFGTESIDQYSFNLEDIILKTPGFLEKIALIHQYDSVLIQEKLNFKEEYKIIFLYGNIFSAKALSEKILALCSQLLSAFKDYACFKSEFMPDIFSIDLLESASGDLVILEANARPAGIFKCVEYFYYLGDF
ncbi:MAG: hypothetical protein ACOYK1_00895 [Vampirovibrionia bacterium]